MKTQVVMKRKLFGSEISQQSDTSLFSATDLVAAGNKWRVMNDMKLFDITEFFRQKGTQDFIVALEQQFGVVKKSAKGRNSHTWVHPLLFIDIALAISPKLKIEVYTWLYDYLIKFRNNSGDSYKKMCGAIFLKIANKSLFKDCIINTALNIQNACNVKNWQEATQEQLNLRDKIHNNIALLSDVLTDIDQAIRIGIEKAIE